MTDSDADHEVLELRELEDLLATDGFVVVPHVCDDDLVRRLLDASRRNVRRAQDSLGSKEIGIGSAAGYAEIVQRSPGRWDVPIDPTEFGLELTKAPWWPLIESALGSDAELWVSGVISSDPGSPEQYWHSDSPHETAEHGPANVVTILVALHDIPIDMGPTEFARASHRMTNHLHNPGLVVEELIYQHAGTTPETLVAGTSGTAPEAYARPLVAGSCIAFDDRVLHRGKANESSETRHVAYFTYRRSGYSTDTYFETERSVEDP